MRCSADRCEIVMEEAKKPEEGLCSPIAEVTVEVLTRVEVKHWAGSTRLVYFSDMAQNTQIYSAFRSTRCFPVIAQRDHTTDGRPLIQYFERHRTMMNLANSLRHHLPGDPGEESAPYQGHLQGEVERRFSRPEHQRRMGAALARGAGIDAAGAAGGQEYCGTRAVPGASASGRALARLRVGRR